MVSVGVSKLGYTNTIFVDPGVKVNGAYYRDILLSQQLLPAIWQVYSVLNFWVLNRSARHCLSALSAQGALDVQPPSARDSCIHLARFVVAVHLTTKSGASANLDKSAQDVDDMRQRLVDVWTGIQQSVIYNAIEWHRRLHTCIQAIGGHF